MSSANFAVYAFLFHHRLTFYLPTIMAITGPTSYVGTTQQFITHWTAVDEGLPVNEKLNLPGGMTLAAFTTQRVLE